MLPLTTRQRDLLFLLIDHDAPVSATDLAVRLGISPRQVSYALDSLDLWLSQYSGHILKSPGVGVQLVGAESDRNQIRDILNSHQGFQLVIDANDRQQLIALTLLTTETPLILHQLQYETGVSRSTILTDLNNIEDWLQTFGLVLVKRPNYGNILEGPEINRREAITALLWGDSPFGAPLTAIHHERGLIFSLSDDKSLLPIVRCATMIISRWDMLAATEWLNMIERTLKGRLADDAKSHLALILAVQAERARSGHFVEVKMRDQLWAQQQVVWDVTRRLAEIIWPDISPDLLISEIALMTLYVLASSRHTMWNGADLLDGKLTELVAALINKAAVLLDLPDLKIDEEFQNGLIAHLAPLWVRQQFSLRFPPQVPTDTLSSQFKNEYSVARQLAADIEEMTGIILPEAELQNLMLLLRAAVIRMPPKRRHRVYVVCPSGMATVQLLVARLKARFPQLEIIDTLSSRELSEEHLLQAELIVTTVPLTIDPSLFKSIQVNPLLPNEDVEAIRDVLMSIP